MNASLLQEVIEGEVQIALLSMQKEKSLNLNHMRMEFFVLFLFDQRGCIKGYLENLRGQAWYSVPLILFLLP